MKREINHISYRFLREKTSIKSPRNYVNIKTMELNTTLLRPRVPNDPRSCQMDGRTISTNIDS